MQNNNATQLNKINTYTTETAPTISLNEAIKRTTEWRKMVSSLWVQGDGTAGVPAKPIPSELIFRAINISMNDIDWLKKQHPDASSIRVYLGIQDPNSPLQIDGILVPVDAQNKDMLTLASKANVSEHDMLNDPANSTIYDVTQPCPTLCNTCCPLFDASNSVGDYLQYKK